jgi:hypothetical protein
MHRTATVLNGMSITKDRPSQRLTGNKPDRCDAHRFGFKRILDRSDAPYQHDQRTSRADC